MNRLLWVLSGLAAVLVVVLWWNFVWSPTADDIADVEDEIVAVEDQTALLRLQAAELRAVRDRAPEIDLELAALDVLIPPDAAVPALLRQVQQIADDAGVRLTALSPSRPSTRDTSAGEVSVLQISLLVEGGYYQVIDLARRLEDPRLVGRGMLFTSLSLTAGGQPPLLSASIGAQTFSQGSLALSDLPAPVAPDPPVDAEADDEDDGTQPAGDPLTEPQP